MILTSRSRFLPTRLSSCRVWFDGSDPNNGALPSNGSLVQNVINKGWTSGVTCTQSTPVNQATFVANQYNGKGILRAAGNQFYPCSGYTYGTAFTIFGVFIPSTTAAYINSQNESGCFITKFNNGSGVQNYEFYHFNTGIADRATLSTSGTGLNIVEVVQTDSVNVSGFFNGASSFSLTPTVSSNGQTLQWILASSSSGSWYNGDFAAFLIFNSALSSSDRSSVRHFLGDYFGVTVT